MDVVVIGAGLSGIAFARFYLDTHPDCRLTVLEKDADIGGVWSKGRVFENFWTQSPIRMTSFSDVELRVPPGVPMLHDTFPARYVSQYLEDYADRHVYAGVSLRNRIQTNVEVLRIERGHDGWIIRTTDTTVVSHKLAIATGLTSRPIMPTFPLHLSGPVLHHRDFSTLDLADPACRQVTVLGGGKSAADMVYACLKAGKRVSWVVRTCGEGPGIFMNPAASGRYRNNAEAGYTQNATKLSPSLFRVMDREARDLHRSSNAERLDEKIYASDRRYKAWANYHGRVGALGGFKGLEPKASFFWNSGPVGMIQHDDFWDLVSQKAHVYRGNPIDSSAEAIALDTGDEIPTDVLLCATGWNPDYPFFAEELARDLGLPGDQLDVAWQELMNAADRQIVEEFPVLAHPPAVPKRDKPRTPAKLYQGIAPLTDPSILFLGRAQVSNNFRGAEAQAIWATAYWDGVFGLPPPAQAQLQVAYMNAFSRRRFPSRGIDGVNFHTDLSSYTDSLITQAGLTSHRKGWWEDHDEPCFARDLRDCTDEYLSKYREFKVHRDGINQIDVQNGLNSD